MFMPQHPVYTKLGINKYCLKNQHAGLNALLSPLYRGCLTFFLQFVLIFSPGDFAHPPHGLRPVFTQIMMENEAQKLTDCSVRMNNKQKTQSVC